MLKNRTVLGAICIVAALLLCFGLAPLLNRAITEKKEIVRIIAPIQKGELITPQAVETVIVGSYNLPKDVLTKKDLVVGKYAASQLYAGDYLVSEKLLDTLNTSDSLLRNLKGNERAISIAIQSFAAGLSGKLQQGDIVSVIAVDEHGGTAAIPPELTYVEVLTATDAKGGDTDQESYQKDEDKDQEDSSLPATITLKVTQEQAVLLARLSSTGTLHASLVYRGNASTAAEYISAQAAALQQLSPAATQESGQTASSEGSK